MSIKNCAFSQISFFRYSLKCFTAEYLLFCYNSHMRILLIGTKKSVQEIKDMVADLAVEIVCCYAEDTSNIKFQIASLPSNIDGIFATGKAVYYEVINNFHPTVPIFYAKRLVLGFSKCIVSYLHSKNRYEKPLFDIIDKKLVEYLIAQYELNFKQTTVIEYDQQVSESNYLLSYIELYKQGKVDVIFTAFGYTYDTLKSLNIPCYRIPVTKYDLMADFQKLIREIELESNKHKNITVHNLIFAASPDEQERFFNDYASFVQGIYLNSNGRHLVISNFCSNIDQLCLYLQNSLDEANRSKLRISIADGNNIQNCIANSIYAHSFTDADYPLAIYTERKIKRLNFSADTQAISIDIVSEISGKTGILRKHLYKLFNYLQINKRDTVTAAELAEILGLTKRSANRIINSLIQAKYADEVAIYSDSIGRREKCIKLLY